MGRGNMFTVKVLYFLIACFVVLVSMYVVVLISEFKETLKPIFEVFLFFHGLFSFVVLVHVHGYIEGVNDGKEN